MAAGRRFPNFACLCSLETTASRKPERVKPSTRAHRVSQNMKNPSRKLRPTSSRRPPKVTEATKSACTAHLPADVSGIRPLDVSGHFVHGWTDLARSLHQPLGPSSGSELRNLSRPLSRSDQPSNCLLSLFHFGVGSRAALDQRFGHALRDRKS